MEICIRENYIDKISLTKTHIIIDEFGKEHEELMYRREDLIKPPYNYKIVEIDDKYADCVISDFNDDLSFNVEKYNARKQKENNQLRINEIKPRLEQLSQDLIQAQVGAVFEDLEERKAEFITLHNELRQLLGMPAREYRNSNLSEN